ncbi:MAG: hypothetical protein V1929_02640 [bacterium]
MSEFTFFCNNCGAKLAAESEDVGSECECPKCSTSQVINVPAVEDDTPIAPIGRNTGKKKITISGPTETTFSTDPCAMAVDDTGVGRVFRVLAAVLGLAGLAVMGLAFFWLATPADQQPPWMDRAVRVVPLALSGFMAIILARMASIIGSLGIRYERE